MFCEKCGNKINENANFCSVCGNALNPVENASEIKQTETNSISRTLSAISYALIVIGTIAGFCSISYIIECEAAHTDMTDMGWNYHYNGGQELAITIAVFALSALLIGIFMKVANKK